MHIIHIKILVTLELFRLLKETEFMRQDIRDD